MGVKWAPPLVEAIIPSPTKGVQYSHAVAHAPGYGLAMIDNDRTRMTRMNTFRETFIFLSSLKILNTEKRAQNCDNSE
jgi:hypothetical protein